MPESRAHAQHRLISDEMRNCCAVQAAVAFDLVTVNNRQAACTACKAHVDTGLEAPSEATRGRNAKIVRGRKAQPRDLRDPRKPREVSDEEHGALAARAQLSFSPGRSDQGPLHSHRDGWVAVQLKLAQDPSV